MKERRFSFPISFYSTWCRWEWTVRSRNCITMMWKEFESDQQKLVQSSDNGRSSRFMCDSFPLASSPFFSTGSDEKTEGLIAIILGEQWEFSNYTISMELCFSAFKFIIVISSTSYARQWLHRNVYLFSRGKVKFNLQSIVESSSDGELRHSCLSWVDIGKWLLRTVTTRLN